MFLIQFSQAVTLVVKFIKHLFLRLLILYESMDHLIMMRSILLLIFTRKNRHLFKYLRLLLVCTQNVGMQDEKESIMKILLHAPMTDLLLFSFIRILGSIIHR